MLSEAVRQSPQLTTQCACNTHAGKTQPAPVTTVTTAQSQTTSNSKAMLVSNKWKHTQGSYSYHAKLGCAMYTKLQP